MQIAFGAVKCVCQLDADKCCAVFQDAMGPFDISPYFWDFVCHVVFEKYEKVIQTVEYEQISEAVADEVPIRISQSLLAIKTKTINALIDEHWGMFRYDCHKMELVFRDINGLMHILLIAYAMENELDTVQLLKTCVDKMQSYIRADEAADQLADMTLSATIA